jgi:hypothetical protein
LAENDDIPVPIDDNNNNKRRRGRYQIPRKQAAMREIRRLIVNEGLTNMAICEKLQLPRRTLERYLHEMFAHDSQLLMAPSAQDIASQVAIFKERLARQYEDVISIARNSEAEFDIKLAAIDLACNIDWVITRLTYETPSVIARSVKLDGTKLVGQQKGLNLILKS